MNLDELKKFALEAVEAHRKALAGYETRMTAVDSTYHRAMIAQGLYQTALLEVLVESSKGLPLEDLRKFNSCEYTVDQLNAMKPGFEPPIVCTDLELQEALRDIRSKSISFEVYRKKVFGARWKEAHGI